MPFETQRTGPAAYTSQWPLERTIGDFGKQLKQPSNPYANLSQRCVLQAQVNVLKAMMPEINQKSDTRLLLPHGAIDLGDSYALLRAADDRARPISPEENLAIQIYLRERNGDARNPITAVVRWARLRLPNRQIARSLWKESQRPLNKIRVSRFVKVCRKFFPNVNLSQRWNRRLRSLAVQG